MRVIDAYWDTRNLEKRCVEIEFEENDLFDKDELALSIRDYEYIVAKVPSCSPALSSALQGEGFSFVECSLNYRHNLSNIVPRDICHLFAASKHALANSDSKQYIFDRLNEGLFTTDRVSLDQCFTKKQAACRYVSWIKDELERGAFLYVVTFEQDDIGFFAYKELEPKVSYPFLIGLYPEQRGKHLGSVLIAESLSASKERGCYLSSTLVSSNNLAVIKCHEMVGSYLSDLHYVFIKHKLLS